MVHSFNDLHFIFVVFMTQNKNVLVKNDQKWIQNSMPIIALVKIVLTQLNGSYINLYKKCNAITFPYINLYKCDFFIIWKIILISIYIRNLFCHAFFI